MKAFVKERDPDIKAFGLRTIEFKRKCPANETCEVVRRRVGIKLQEVALPSAAGIRRP